MSEAAGSIAFDANIFFYAVDQKDLTKHERCKTLLQSAIGQGVGQAPLQALGEFAYAVVRKGVLDRSEAATAARDWATVFNVICASSNSFETALDWWRDERMSYWDALLVATVSDNRITALVTEDLHDGTVIAGVEVINPFVDDLNARLSAHVTDLRVRQA